MPTMHFTNIRLPNADFQKSTLPLIVNLAVILAALWLVSCTSLSISELITDSWTRRESLLMGLLHSSLTSDSIWVGVPEGAMGSEG